MSGFFHNINVAVANGPGEQGRGGRVPCRVGGPRGGGGRAL